MSPSRKGGERSRPFSVALLLTLLALSACAPAPPAPETVKIAVIAPLSGEFEPLGRTTRDGVVLALEEWNAQGGVLGRRLEAVLVDSTSPQPCTFKAGLEAAQVAIHDEGASFVIGAVCWQTSEGVAQVVMEEDALQISPATVDPELTLDGEGQTRTRVFRVGFTDTAQGQAMARFAREQLVARTAALLIAEESRYANTLATAFEVAFTDDGGEIVARERYDPDAEVFYDALVDVRDAVPDVIYLPGYCDVVNRLVDQARAFGINARFLGSDGWNAPDLNLTTVAGSYFVVHYFAQDMRLGVREWSRRFQARYIVAPDALATMGYDAATILLSAIQEAESFDPTTVAQTMETMEFALITGPMRYDAQHNPVKPIPILQVRGGEVHYVTSITLEEE